MPAGKTRDRKGNPLTIKVKGTVEPFFRDYPGRRTSRLCARRASANTHGRHVTQNIVYTRHAL